MENTEDPSVIKNHDYGEKLGYNETGPIETTRRRTDPCWFLGFMYFLILWCCVIIYAFMEGDPGKYLRPVDSEGRSCGWNSPYLVWYNRENCSKNECLMCQPACPKIDFVYPDWKNLTGGHNAPKNTSVDVPNNASVDAPHKVSVDAPKNTSVDAPNKVSVDVPKKASVNTPKNASVLLEETLKLMICKPGIVLNKIKSWDQLDYLVNVKKCAKTYNRTKVDNNGWCDFEDEDHRYSDWRYSLPRLDRDINRTKKSIMSFIIISGCIAVASLMLLRWYPLSFTCVSMIVFYSVAFNFIYEKFITDDILYSKTNGVLASLVISVILLVLMVLLTAYYWKKISVACQLLNECITAILDVKSTLVWALILAIAALFIVDLGFRIALGLSSIESPIYEVHNASDSHEVCTCPSNLDYSHGSACNTQDFKRCRTNGTKPCVLSGCFEVRQELRSNWVWHIVNGLSIYWSFWFIVAFADTTLAGVFANWYWTFNKKILKKYLVIVENFWRVCTFHIGTVVLGSLIILVCSIIRAILNFISSFLLRTKQPVAALILLHLKCIFDLTDSFLNYIDRRALIMCAIHGTDFMESATSGYNLLKRNISKVVIKVQLSNWLLTALAFLISFTISRISTSYYSAKPDLTYAWVPSFMVFVGSFVTCFLLLRVLEIAVDTLFYSFLEDSERNDGTVEKPYFSSEEFVKLLCDK